MIKLEPLPPRVGCFFHVLDDEGVVQYQGKILDKLDGERWIVETYSWIDGTPDAESVIAFDDPKTSRIYRTPQAMRLAFERAADATVRGEGGRL